MKWIMMLTLCFGALAADELDKWIAPPLPLGGEPIRQVDRGILQRGFTGEKATQSAEKNTLLRLQERTFPLGRLLFFLVLYTALWLLYRYRKALIAYFKKVPPTPEEVAREQLLLWEREPPKTAEEFSARYASLTALARSRFELPLSLSAEAFVEKVDQKSMRELFAKAEKAKFAHIPPSPAEYEADLQVVKSLFFRACRQ